MTTITLLAFYGIFLIIVYVALSQTRKRKQEILDLSESEAIERKENPSAFYCDTDQVWMEYMGVRFPLLRSEIPTWKALSVDSKKSWIKQLKSDIACGKKIPVKDSHGVVIGYKVKDRKTKLKEDLREEIYKKVNNL